MTTWGQYQKSALLTHPGWIPDSPWEELEDLRQELFEHLKTPHHTVAEVYMEYEARDKAYKRELKEKMLNRSQVPGGFLAPSGASREARELVPSQNELANAEAEEHAWTEALIAIAQKVSDVVDENGQVWQAELGDVDGLADFASKTAQTQQYLRHASGRYPFLATPELFEEVIELIGELPVEARRVHRLYQWLEMTMAQPLGIGFAFYESRDELIPGFNDEEEDDEDA